MKIYKKLLFFLLFFAVIVSANTTYISEPILNSTVHVQTYGDENKEVVVLVHGLGDEASTIWDSSIAKLKDEYFVISLDLPGFGKSSKQSAEYTPTKYALVLDYIVSNYTNKPFYLIGHSMGGAISLKYTQFYESKVKKLFLIDVAGVLNKDAYSQFLIKTGVDRFFKIEEKNIINEKISNIFSSITNGINKLMPSNLHEVVRTDYLRNNLFQSNPTAIAAIGLITEDFYNLEKINTPTLILWGEKDEVTPLRTGYVLNKLLKNSTLEIIKDSGHVPIIDSSSIYLDYLDKFLNNKIENKAIKLTNIISEEIEITNQNSLRLECNAKLIRIINSKNIELKNCNLENINIINSSVSIINSTINSQETAVNINNSRVQITATDIKGEIAIDSFKSRLDLAAVNIDSTETSILSRGKNEIIFSLTRLKDPTSNKIMHKKVTITNNKL